MKLRNKTTGEIGNLISTNWNETALTIMDKDGVQLAKYTSLAELNTEWEDYEEPKTFFTIYYDGTISEFKGGDDEQIRDMKEIGNYFETREEAERAIEKLNAWKRLKEAGFEFKKWKHKSLFSYHYGTVKQIDGYKIYIEAVSNKLSDNMQDLDLLFGGGE